MMSKQNRPLPLYAKEVRSADIQKRIDEMRASGKLTKAIRNGKPCYQSSKRFPGMLEKVYPNGLTVLGQYENGKFIPKVIE
jgi:hypothetical protein